VGYSGGSVGRRLYRRLPVGWGRVWRARARSLSARYVAAVQRWTGWKPVVHTGRCCAASEVLANGPS